ncbi:MAG TPA: LytTR family DNA-binding domain-containing protein [Aquabacterium sp.]|nr:LytTR family DNA-binding domain-containing protein [Aquabacterium sp.]
MTASPALPTLRALIVDDEPLARARMITLLQRADQGVQVMAELGDSGAALAWLEAHPQAVDVVFLDIQMPGPDGLRLADKLRQWPHPLQVVFVTAHAEHALRAFELQACDYLTKPVRLDRLQQALARCSKLLQPREALNAAPPVSDEPVIVVQDRGRVVRVPAGEVLYLKAELKYVTVRTAATSWLVDESLSELEARLGSRFIRVHRNALVARSAMARLERRDDPDGHGGQEGWAVQVRPTGEWLAVSRRQAAAVRETIAAQ